MRGHLRSVFIVRGLLIKRLLRGIKRYVLRRNLLIHCRNEFNRKLRLLRSWVRFRLGIRMNSRMLLPRHVESVEGFSMWSEYRDMSRFAKGRLRLRKRRRKWLRRIIRIRRILSGRSNMRSLCKLWSIWSRLRSMKIEGFLLRIFLLLLSQKMQTTFYASLVVESTILLCMKDTLKCVITLSTNQRHWWETHQKRNDKNKSFDINLMKFLFG